MLKKLLLVLLIVTSTNLFAGNKIKVYFNHPVDTTVSTTIGATYLNHCLPDTIIAYINRAKYTLDVAVYNYTQGVYDTIANAVNNAYNRGVNVRWICDGSSSNTGTNLLNPAINIVHSPTTGSYTIMHNKVVIIDANSTNPDDAVVITGSCNWTSQQFFTDYNNTIIFQDSALAKAYTAEFEMMWGSNTLVPNSTLALFGNHKTDLGLHNFIIEGKHVELYFSPSDSTNTHIQNTIATADKDLYFGMYSFTDNADATMIVAKHISGVYVAGIDDTASATYAPYTTFNAGLGSNFITYVGTGLYHNKYMIVDQADKCSDPLVLTGSHNWSAVANSNNDENTVIVHDDTIANIYYQYFHANFVAFGGSLTIPTGCPTFAASNTLNQNACNIYPNPSTGAINMETSLVAPQIVTIELLDMLGKKVAVIANNEPFEAGTTNNKFTVDVRGLYFLRVNVGGDVLVKKVLVD